MGEERSVLNQFVAWVESLTDGDWEHDCGLEIGMLDNPGWVVRIHDLEEVPLPAEHNWATDDGAKPWWKFEYQDGTLVAMGDIYRLPFLLASILHIYGAVDRARALELADWGKTGLGASVYRLEHPTPPPPKHEFPCVLVNFDGHPASWNYTLNRISPGTAALQVTWVREADFVPEFLIAMGDFSSEIAPRAMLKVTLWTADSPDPRPGLLINNHDHAV